MNIKSSKSLLISIIILFLYSNISAQVEGDIIELNPNVKVIDTESSITDLQLSNNANYLESGIKFKVISITDNQVKLIAIPFTHLKPNSKKEDKSLVYNNKIYIIKRTDFNENAKKIEQQDLLSIGLLTLPFKARPQGGFSFDTEFNLNSTLNLSVFQGRDLSFNVQVGAGIGTVGLNTSNSLGLSKNEAQDVSTLTFLSGLMLQYKKVQVGLYAGVDHINNQSIYKWESNGNMWFGFGIGYDLFNISLAKTKNKQ